ncbi:MAG: hypothetical protein HY907_16755 [Deltaproteobacteria bacterium]|nr:hypothetical protein [Deltaproteobacteria bacterium]
MRTGVAIAAALFLAACGPQGAGGDAGPEADGGDAMDAADTGPEPCAAEGALECTADGYAIRSCAGGVWTISSDCMREAGRLCEDAACVEPWLYGTPEWDTCADEPRATAESLAEKAARYDALATRLHIHPLLRGLAPVHLPSGVTEATATFADVDGWRSGENDGLWSALYLAAQAYRYAVTRDAESLATIRELMDGEAARMRITGVSGVFTRQMIPPGVAGLSCPSDPSSYVPDVEKDDNKWVQIRGDGCVWVVDGTTMAWAATTHCGLDEFSGWCFLDNVSKDEYAGHLFALGSVWRLVEDEAVRALAAELLGEIADHLLANEMALVDWDGRVTEHGRFYAWALDDFPGFNAALALSLFAAAAAATGRDDLRTFYEECLLQEAGRHACIDRPLELPRSYLEHLPAAGLYGEDGCRANFNNISMHFLSLYGLLAFEREPSRREAIQASLAVHVWSPPEISRAARVQHNAWFDFLWAAGKRVGPGSDGPALGAVRDGACMLRQFPASYAERFVPVPPGFEPFCLNRFDESASEHAREIADRCAATFVWWRDPFSLTDACSDDPQTIHPPTGYLLAYWMARAHGFLSAAD